MNKSPIQLKDTHNRVLSAYTVHMQRERYSRQTMRNYTNHFLKFLQHCDNRTPADLTNDEITAYIESVGKQRNLSNSTVTVLSYSIKYYYERVLHSPKHIITLTSKK